MMRYLLMGLILLSAVTFLSAASPKASGTLELLNQPVYGGEAVFHVVLNHHASLPNTAIWCSQDGTYVRVNEQYLPQFGSKLDLVFARPLITTLFDDSKPMNCSAVVFQDTRNGSQQPEALTNWVNFIVPATG